MNYIAVCFSKITFSKANKIDRIEQVSFPQTIVAINAYNIIVEIKIMMQIVFELVNGYVL